MPGTRKVSCVREHRVHVYRPSNPCAVCGDIRPQDWLVRQDWMRCFDPESLCAGCLAVLRERDQMRGLPPQVTHLPMLSTR
jgi:hypothetical protein